MIRNAQYAGSWYPGNSTRLRSDLAGYMQTEHNAEPAMGVIAPHAGMTYSGPVAGALYGRVTVPDTVVLLSVNHRGLGSRAAVMCSGSWETPLGQVPVEQGLALSLMKNAPILQDDATAHSREHSLELHLPFLQYRNKLVRIVPICLQHLEYSECETLGSGLARTVQESGMDVLLVASTDMTHFESQESARKKDKLAIQQILDLDPSGLYETVRKHRISMCGVVPATTLLCACVAMGAVKCELTAYATSGDVSGDFSSVVGYASLRIL
jgi:AmmeMemoRadiSam system protein B